MLSDLSSDDVGLFLRGLFQYLIIDAAQRFAATVPRDDWESGRSAAYEQAFDLVVKRFPSPLRERLVAEKASYLASLGLA